APFSRHRDGTPGRSPRPGVSCVAARRFGVEWRSTARGGGSMIGALRCVVLLALATRLADPAAAQPALPSKPIPFLVNFPPGGPSDILARVIGSHVSAALGQPVIVDHKAGATGAIGAAAVAKSPPDGYTVLIAIDSLFTVTPTLQPGLFDTATL